MSDVTQGVAIGQIGVDVPVKTIIIITYNVVLPKQVPLKIFGGSCFEKQEIRKPANWWGSAKRDVTHPTAVTVIYNTCYHLFQKGYTLPCIYPLACKT